MRGGFAPRRSEPTARTPAEGPPGRRRPPNPTSAIMKRALFLVCAAAAALAPRPARADLDAFIRKPEPAYHWEKAGEEVRDGCTITDLRMTSQVWQGITWQHRLQIFRPE